MNKYKEKIYTNCEYEKCNSRIEKGSGKCLDEKWFCSLECVENYLKENEDLMNLYTNDYSDHENLEDFEKYDDNNEEEENSERESLIHEENPTNAYDPMQDF